MKKSGIKSFKSGEIIFQENDVADSLYIIQSGQIRLFRPKGRGFVDLAVLRTGEVIGEMAYFDKKNSRRSCSATAIVPTDIIEISFKAFEKTIQSLNPWLRTIINTLIDRLRNANEKVKSLEPNSLSFGRQGQISDYVFFHTKDVMKILSTLYLVIKNYGDKKNDLFQIHIDKIKFFMFDIYNISEVKYEEFFNVLRSEYFISLEKDKTGLEKIVCIDDPEKLRNALTFFNDQRLLEDSKKIQISSKCERFLKKIIELLPSTSAASAKVDVGSILEDFRERNIPINNRDLRDAIAAGFTEDILVGESGQLTVVAYCVKLREIFPSISLMNAIKRINHAKNGG